MPPHFAPPRYHAKDLPQTTAANETLIKLPSFPNADRELLEHYVAAFQRVIRHAEAIRTKHLEQKPAE